MRPPALPLAVAVLFGVALLGAAPVAAADDSGNVSLYQVPDGVDDDAALERAVENGSADQAEKLALGDGLGIVVESERLVDDMASHNGSETERFFAALDGEADLRVVQTNPPASRVRKVVRLESGDATVHRNGSTVYALLDTGELTFERPRSDGNEQVGLDDGDRFAVTFGYNRSQFADDGPEIELYTTHSEFVTGSTHTYDPLPPEVVNRSVRVNVEPEERVHARLSLDGGRNITAPVEPAPTASNRRVSLDLRDVEPGAGYALQLVHDGDVVDRYEGTVREPTATVTNVTVTEVDDWTAVNATATLSHGGEVRVFNEDGDRLGWTTAAPGEETDVSIQLHGSADELVVRAAREQGAGEAYYADAGRTVDFSDRQLRDPLATPTTTPTATPDASATDTEPGAASPTDDQPGFGSGAAVVAALLASALLARRRG